MDNLTHSLVGALLGQAGLKRRTGLAMPALIFGANLPDVDAGCVVYGMESLAMRRGLTHGPIAWVLLPLLLAGFLWWFDRWQAKRGTRPEDRLPVHFGWLYLLAFVGCLSHPALDWMNSYGIRLLEPFSSRWFYGDTLFIIDVWIWAAMILAFVFSRRIEKRGTGNWRRPALLGLVAVLGYINFNMVVTATARAQTPQAEAIASPVPLAFWARDMIIEVDGPIYRGKAKQRWTLGQGLADDQTLLTDKPACIHPLQLPMFASENAELRAFLFWSRAPYVEREERDGRMVDVLKDARFDGRFEVVVDVPAEAEECYSE
ncbi:metal-dependent hydrolase [Croceicoccus gelatinilyticus]|uniref:metal-dependent hydrolase n=1 Tax=Croceicoccus gelatinilyticus TaxID=2835536 RepID=UPI001BCC7ABF|nr:metal-dependent hydrolase [Croceicoccus gelatinilyticus]MBS7670454.1 metal-dependent hydrolase [Croceicoccus gelatinilyticus]